MPRALDALGSFMAFSNARATLREKNDQVFVDFLRTDKIEVFQPTKRGADLLGHATKMNFIKASTDHMIQGRAAAFIE